MEQAVAYIFGAGIAPHVTGVVRFSDGSDGFTRVDVDIKRLSDRFHGFHIHEKGICRDEMPEPFASAGPHYNPEHEKHGFHAGDLPALMPSDGRARMTFYTKKFRVSDVIGRSVVVHEYPDDFKTDPGGNSGRRIACGVIRRVVEGKHSYSG